MADPIRRRNPVRNHATVAADIFSWLLRDRLTPHLVTKEDRTAARQLARTLIRWPNGLGPKDLEGDGIIAHYHAILTALDDKTNLIGYVAPECAPVTVDELPTEEIAQTSVQLVAANRSEPELEMAI